MGSTAFLCASSVSLNLSPLQPCKGKKQLPPLEVRLGQSVAASLLHGQLTRRPICLILLLEAGWIEVISHFGRRANLTLSSCELLSLSPPIYPTQTHKRGPSHVSAGILDAVSAASGVGKHLGAA